MIGRRAFVVGSALLAGCRACVVSKKPVAAVPYRFVYRAKGTIETFIAGNDAHTFIESTQLADGGFDKSVKSYVRSTGAITTLFDGEVDPVSILAVSPGCIWFRSDGKLARIPRTGGPATTHFRLPGDVFPIWADDDGVYAYRAHIVSDLALGTNVDLMSVSDTGEEKVLARELFPDRETKITSTKDDVVFWNKIKPAGVVLVSKNGGPLRESSRMLTKEIVQTGHTYRPESDGVFEVDPATGAKRTKLMPATSDTVLGVIPAGVVIERTQYKSASFGSRSASSYYALDLYDTTAQRDGRIFDFRGGSVLGAGEIPGGLAWATLSEIGELG